MLDRNFGPIHRMEYITQYCRKNISYLIQSGGIREPRVVLGELALVALIDGTVRAILGTLVSCALVPVFVVTFLLRIVLPTTFLCL